MIKKIVRLAIPIMATVVTLAAVAPAQASPDNGKSDVRSALQNAASEDSSQQAAAAQDCGVAYRVHIRNIGWQTVKCDGDGAGTVGQNLPIEAIEIAAVGGVCYAAYLQNLGWQEARCDGTPAGTIGEARHMEAISISGGYQICYIVHVQNLGWQPEMCDGYVAGTIGQNLALEAIRIYFK